MSRTISTKTAAIGAGLLVAASVATAVAFDSAAAGAAARPTAHTSVHKAVRPAAAAPVSTTKIFIAFAGYKGDSTDKAHPGTSLASSVQLGMGRGSANSPVSFSELTVSKPVDSSTPNTMQAVAKGTLLAKVDVYFVSVSSTGAEKTVTHYQLQQVYVSADSVSNSATNESEALSLRFNKILFAQTSPKGTLGPTTFTWNIASNDNV